MTAIKDKVISLGDLRPAAVGRLGGAARPCNRTCPGRRSLGLVAAELIGGDADRNVLKPSGTTTLPDGGAGLTVDDATKQDAVDRFLEG